MRRKRAVRIPYVSWAAWLPALVILSIFFLLGVFSGCFLAYSLSGTESNALSAYMEGYLRTAHNGNLPSSDLLSVLWETFRWPLLVFLLSFTAAGLVGLPIVFGIRGFLFSFAVACFIRIFGSTGAILSFLLFGITGMFSFPALFILGTQGMTACRILVSQLMGERKKGTAYGREYFGRCGICTAILACCVCLEQTVVPSLMMALAGTF